MADEQPQADIDRDDNLRHGSQEAREAAKQKMQAAMKEQQDEEVVKDQATLETDRDKNVSTKKAGKDETPPLDTTILENVKVYSPFRVYYDGKAHNVSAENLTGPFDILPGHKNFMSLLTAGDIVVRSDKGEERIKTDRGIMHVRANKVTIFLDV